MRQKIGFAAFLLLIFVSSGRAVGLAPCTDAGSMTILPLSNGHGTYCVSDFGWSDTWFVGTSPALYDAARDVFSGDDSPNLHFGILGGANWRDVTGFGWLSPIMDAGTRMPSVPTASPLWAVTSTVHYTGLLSTESTILHPAGMEARIVTTIDPVDQRITQTFMLTNLSVATFTDIVLADYFNYHPNGTTILNAAKGTASYSPLTGITITGIDDGTLIATGSMRGEVLDTAHGLSSVPITMDMVQTVDYVATASPVGPGDVAGALAWRLADLAPGASVSFSIFKNSEPLAVPEPASLLMLIAPLIALAARHRRRFYSGSL